MVTVGSRASGTHAAPTERRPMQVTTEITLSRIASLLCCAMEGGSGYWCRAWDYVEPKQPVSHMEGMGTIFRHIDWPLTEGGAMLLWDIEEHSRSEIEADASKLLRLDLDAIKRGLD